VNRDVSINIYFTFVVFVVPAYIRSTFPQLAQTSVH